MAANAGSGGAVVILLGAGRPYRGVPPSAIQETPDRRRVLDWILDAFSGLQVEWHFVGGYQLRDIVRRYPRIAYSVNAAWETTGTVASLFCAPLSSARTHFVAYTDVVFDREVVQHLAAADAADVVLAVDRTWRRRYERRRPEEILIAEKVQLDGERVVAAGRNLGPRDAHAEYAGLLRLSPAAMERVLRLRERARHRFSAAGIPELLGVLIEEGLSVCAVDVGGRWAELNAPQDLARFVLGTKAQTLERLRPVVRHCSIGEQVTFTVETWRSDADSLLDRIHARFGGREAVVRSSALAEDSWSAANAGVFASVTGVPVDDPARLRAAVDRVAASFEDGNPDNQVLVQEMLTGVRISGVAFTRSLSSGAPYYVINYDDTTGSTESVTGGAGRQLKTLVLHRKARRLPRHADPMLSRLLRALRELETLVGHDSLDVEFAITRDGAVHVLQVRPIAVDHSQWRVSDELVGEMLQAAERDFRDRQARSSFTYGRRTIFGIMPDWNPAEIIGTKPRRLAASLYRYLVTDEVWATERAEFGYRDVRPCPLMVSFLGHPYIDVRASFSSFVPAALPDSLGERLVEAYLDRLEAHPHLHDKIEFEIAFTCLTLDFETQARRLIEAGIAPADVELLGRALGEITRHGLARYEGDLARVAALEKRFEAVARLDAPPLVRACVLLEECRRNGTLPFAHLAREAFVATALLRSAVREGLISEEELDAFMGSLNTVARGLAADGAAVAAGAMSWETYVARYGHLRPGTYEISSPSYAEDPERYLSPVIAAATAGHEVRRTFSWSEKSHRALAARLARVGLLEDGEGLHRFERFCRAVIEGREASKFSFTRHLSAALDEIAAFGETIGLSRDQLSHVAVEDLQAVRAGMVPSDVADWLLERAEEGERWHKLAQAVELPPLLFSADDLYAFVYPESRPNFVSLGRVTAEVADLTDPGERPTGLAGRIVLIPAADPGYDWLFGQKVAGLVTMYGGANSHMAIRAAEFGLPAAIGVGESLYAHYRHARVLHLDCAGGQIQVVR